MGEPARHFSRKTNKIWAVFLVKRRRNRVTGTKKILRSILESIAHIIRTGKPHRVPDFLFPCLRMNSIDWIISIALSQKERMLWVEQNTSKRTERFTILSSSYQVNDLPKSTNSMLQEYNPDAACMFKHRHEGRTERAVLHLIQI